MGYCVVRMVQPRPESSACIGERIGEFASESDALAFASAARGADAPHGCELVVRRESAREPGA